MRGRRVWIFASVAALSAGWLVATVGPAGAIAVSTEAQLRAAFANAAETDITLTNGIDLADCTAVGGDLDRTSVTALTLSGNGFTIRQTCAGERVIEAGGTGAVTLTGVTITGGTPAADDGGGIYSNAPVILINSVVSGNAAPGGSGGGVSMNAGGLTVTNSTISGNASDDGGGLYVNGGLTLTSSTVSGNTSTDNGGGITINSGGITVTNSTVSGNTGANQGGGIYANGGITITNSTITRNTSTGSDGGGIQANGGDLTLVYVTVVQNTAGTGANISAIDTLTSFGSVVALPQGGGTNCASVNATTSNGFNFSDSSACGFTGTGDRENAGDPALGALADNGGPTQTRLPQAGSPLIDAIPTSSCGFAGVTADQRGLLRPAFAGCDIGAVEIQPPATAITVTPRFTG